MRKYITVITTLSLLSISQIAQAEFNGFGQSEGFTLGGGVITEFSPYEGVETPDINPVPYIAFDWENAHIGVDGVTYSFFNTDNLEITVLAEPRWSFADPDESPLFEGIERKTALEVGASAKLALGNLYAEAQFQHDVTDIHNGYEVMAKIGLEQEFGRFAIDIGGGTSFQDKKLNAHLFGVRPEEARADLPEFSPRGSFNYFAETELGYALGDKTMIFGFARYTRLSKRVRISPLVNKKRSATMGLAILRRF